MRKLEKGERERSMKKITILLLILGLSLILTAGDHLNHPVYYYDVISDNMTTEMFDGSPDSWGVEGNYVTTDPTNSLSNMEPGSLSNGMPSGEAGNEGGMLMNETNWPGNPYIVYVKYKLSAIGDADKLYIGVKVWDDVIVDAAMAAAAGISIHRADAIELRFDPSNDAAQTTESSAGVDCDGGNGYNSYRWPRNLLMSTNNVTVPNGNANIHTNTASSTNPELAVWDAGDILQANGLFTGGYYINFVIDMSQDDLRASGGVSKHIYDYASHMDGDNEIIDNYGHILSMGLAIVIKDNDWVYGNNADQDRTWNSGLHNSDLSCTYYHGGDWAYEGQWADVTCNTPSFWGSIEPRDGKIQWDLPNCSLSGANLTLDWEAADFPADIDVQGYRVYGSDVWNPTFNKYPDFYYMDWTTYATVGTSSYRSRYYYADDSDYGVSNVDEVTNTLPDIAVNQGWVQIGGDIAAATTSSTFEYGSYKFFLVTALIDDGSDDDTDYDEYPIPSEVLGFHQFTLTTQDPGTDLNFVGLPFAGNYTTASELGDAIGLGVGGLISQWDPVNQAWNSSSNLPGFDWVNDFDLDDAPALMIGATDAVNGDTFTNIGVLAQLPQYELIFTAGTNQNLVTVPVNSPSGLVDASDILDLSNRHFDGINNHGQGVGDIAGTVSKWDFASQSWTTYTDGVGAGDFTVSKGDPLSINLFNGMSTLWPVYDNHEDRNCSMTIHE